MLQPTFNCVCCIISLQGPPGSPGISLMGQKGEPGASGPGFPRGIAFGNPSMIAPPSGFSRAGEGSFSLTTGVNRLVLQKAAVEHFPPLHLLHSVAQGCAGFSHNFFTSLCTGVYRCQWHRQVTYFMI